MKIIHRRILLLSVGAALAVLLTLPFVKRSVLRVAYAFRGHHTVSDRIAQYGEAARERLAPDFARIGAPYPPKQVTLVGLKQERRLEVWVSGDSPNARLLRSYPILGASGELGPKLREGDGQVPEGLYRVESLNPNSRFHLALRVNYPNEFDQLKGQADGRPNLGGDIMIHGGKASIGCLAMGDEAIEEIFVLTAETGAGNVSVILAPVDFRVAELPPDRPISPPWIDELYSTIREALPPLTQAETRLP